MFLDMDQLLCKEVSRSVYKNLAISRLHIYHIRLERLATHRNSCLAADVIVDVIDSMFLSLFLSSYRFTLSH